MRDTADVRTLVQQECRRSANAFGYSFFDEHLAVVAEYGLILADRLGADPEIVELAAWLHDLSAVRDVSSLPRHTGLSAELAIRILSDRGFPQAKVEQVAQCIRAHSSPLPVGSATPEEVCVSNADAIAQIVRPAYWLYFAFALRKCSFEDGRQWYLQRIQANWNSLIDPARKMAADGYRLATDILRA